MEVTDSAENLSELSLEPRENKEAGGAHSLAVAKANDAWDQFLKSLEEKGYTVLLGMERMGQVPTSLILAADLPGLASNLKADFYAFANRCDIHFDSGEAYTEQGAP